MDFNETGFMTLFINSIACGVSAMVIIFANRHKYGHSFFVKANRPLPGASVTTEQTVPRQFLFIYPLCSALNIIAALWLQFRFTDDRWFMGFFLFEVCVFYSVVLIIPSFRFVGLEPASPLIALGAIAVLLLGVGTGTITQEFESARLYYHFKRHPLSHFPDLVYRPNIEQEVHLEIEDALELMNPCRINVLAGVPGCGKSVSLYKFLAQKQTPVIWLNGRRSICKQLSDKLSFKRATSFAEEDCLRLIVKLLETNEFTLVIDDVQALAFDQPMVSLFKGFGADLEIPFPIFFTTSDYILSLNKFGCLIQRIA
ncbi:hypothetical protein RCL1_008442 [Eukaryota sp. TZLM3-RCL]